jgi:hypothetical protein
MINRIERIYYNFSDVEKGVLGRIARIEPFDNVSFPEDFFVRGENEFEPRPCAAMTLVPEPPRPMQE